MNFDDYEQDWQNAPEDDLVDDGEYYLLCRKAVLKEVGPDRKNAGTPMVSYELSIMGPRRAGKVLFKNSLFTPDGIKWIKIDLAKLGIRGIQSLSELPDRLHEAAGVGIKANIITNEYQGRHIQNIYFKGTFDPNSYEPPLPDDDIPF